jgi:hypothetical protein
MPLRIAANALRMLALALFACTQAALVAEDYPRKPIVTKALTYYMQEGQQ